ncbi:MAG: hypothetical protein ACK5IM_10470 [Demequina sp.]|uniref:hypothetical protein n=1 Tax=Demequina sp. TaxID=2050685 RepID=UPI003A869C49
MSTPEPVPVGVAGGAGGTQAVTEDLASASAVLSRAGDALDTCLRALNSCAALLDDAARDAGPAVAGAVTRADAAVGHARWGLGGVGALARDADDLGVRLTAVARTYEEAEERARGGIGIAASVARAAHDAVATQTWVTRTAMGLGWAISVPGIVGRLMGRDPVGEAVMPDGSPPMTGYINRGTVGTVTGALGTDVIMDQSAYDAVVMALLGATRGLDALFEDRYTAAVPRGPRTRSEVATSMEDLAASLADLPAPPEGAVAIDELMGADGKRRYVVTIPGTADWGHRSVNTADGEGNAAVAAGQESDAMRLAVDAMVRMGIPRDAEVMLVGHSQGGMVSTAIAGVEGISERFTITDVVTFGSPVGHLPRVDGVRYAHVEDVSDMVPALDKGANPESANVTTWTGDARASGDKTVAAAAATVLGAHAMTTYRATGKAIDGLDDASTKAWREGTKGYTTSVSANRTLFSPATPPREVGSQPAPQREPEPVPTPAPSR